mgnify:CR=1 FL=1
MAECPECAAELDLAPDTEEGEIVVCPDCGVELEVLSVEPISLTAWRHAVVVASSILVASEAHEAVRRRWPIEPRR